MHWIERCHVGSDMSETRGGDGNLLFGSEERVLDFCRIHPDRCVSAGRLEIDEEAPSLEGQEERGIAELTL